MKRGAWHQCGDKSQRLVEEQLKSGIGVGAILSPRDLARTNASKYAATYQGLGTQVLLDSQFYVPTFSNDKLSTYALDDFRTSVSSLGQVSDSELDRLSRALEEISRELRVSAVIAPAVLYQAGRIDIVLLNARLFGAAKRAGDALGVPTYASVVLAQSIASSNQTLPPMLSQITALDADGWYFSFEFAAERIPSDRAAVERAGTSLLTLACTGKPVLHAFAGPMSLLSFGFGASAAGVGHSQNTWRFTPTRWLPKAGGGGGDAPPRFFSSALWGTIVYPDETARLPAAIASQVLTHSPYSGPVAQKPSQTWSRWDANKHLVHVQCEAAGRIASNVDARVAAAEASRVLCDAVALHGQVAGTGLQLADSSSSYQSNWREAVTNVLKQSSADYDYLEMIR